MDELNYNASESRDEGMEPRVLADGEAAQVQEVFAPVNEPFEKPAAEKTPGDLYTDADEVDPGLAPAEEAAALSENNSPIENPKLAVDRRDFMKLFGASVAAASAACVRRPAEKAVPYVDQPVDTTPGVSVHYATTCGECAAGCGVTVKTRDGRPVKVEGTDGNPVSQGASCSLGQSTLQALYHPERRKAPAVRRGDTLYDATWEEVPEAFAARLSDKKNIAIFTGASTGHRHGFFRRVLKQMGMSENNLFTYDSNQLYSAQAAAYRLAFGVEMIPRIELRNARVVCGIGSDFLEIGISPVFAAKSFADGQALQGGSIGHFVQFESAMSQTGGRANERHVIPPGSELLVALSLLNALLNNSKSRGSKDERDQISKLISSYKMEIDSASQKLGVDSGVFVNLAEALLSNPAVVIVGGSANFDEKSTALQLAGILINKLVGSYGITMHVERGWFQAPVVAGDLKRFYEAAPKIDALIFIDTNPAFTLPKSWDFAAAVKHIPFICSIQSLPNETDQLAHFVLPGHHYLESWGDEQPVAGFWTLRQPAVRPVSNSQQAEDILLFLLAAMRKPMTPFKEYYDYVKEEWKSVHKLLAANVSYDTFFKAVQRRGFVGKMQQRTIPPLANVLAHFPKAAYVHSDELKLIAPLDVRLRDGKGSDRPVLQEIGDSMTTIAWDSWVAMNPGKAKELGFKRNDVLRVEGPAGVVELALYPLPGLHPQAVVIHRGNGRAPGVLKVTDGYGVNPLEIVAKSQDTVTGEAVCSLQTVKVSKTSKVYQLAAMQKHHDISNRHDIVKKMSVKEAAEKVGPRTKSLDDVPDIFPKLKEGEHRWGMSIDLNSCTGCGSCMVACATENNVPQVGRELVKMGRAMHWIRLDRYFYGDLNNPEVSYQPMLCQHCMHAPCEAVCPVFATTHDPDGINSQTYNRCVGTRYCANACPYKVRRFNWFTYKWNEIGARERDRNPRALNPDVTVRTRGVMEKCTFCIQRIKEVKHESKVSGREIVDGQVRTACQQACPSSAIVFGDLKSSSSRVARLRREQRSYLALGGDPDHGHYGLKTLPNVSYMAKIVLKSSGSEHGGGHGSSHGDKEHSQEHG